VSLWRSLTTRFDAGLALADFRKNVLDPRGVFRSWNFSDASPCKWRGVVCDNVTNQVIILYTLQTQLATSRSTIDLPFRALGLFSFTRSRFCGIQVWCTGLLFVVVQQLTKSEIKRYDQSSAHRVAPTASLVSLHI
jgi:hypothetical protein